MSNTVIHTIVDIFVKPESIEKVRALLLKLVEQSLKEDGCLYYKLFENIHDQFQFTFIGMWANENAHEDHLQSEHVRKVSFDIYDDLTKPPDIKRYKSIQLDFHKTKVRSTTRICVII